MFLVEVRIDTVYEDDNDKAGTEYCFMQIVEVPLCYASFLGDYERCPYKNKYDGSYYTTKYLVETFLTDSGIVLDGTVDVQLKLVE